MKPDWIFQSGFFVYLMQLLLQQLPSFESHDFMRDGLLKNRLIASPANAISRRMVAIAAKTKNFMILFYLENTGNLKKFIRQSLFWLPGNGAVEFFHLSG
jgi:hypothetical protein